MKLSNLNLKQRSDCLSRIARVFGGRPRIGAHKQTAVIFLSLAVAATLFKGGGFLKEDPANQISVTCSKRNPIFYVGEPISFSSDKPCLNYEVRDYFGTIVDKGKSLAQMRAEPPGWYKIYMRTANGGNQEVRGTTTFAVFRSDDRFPVLPDKSVPGGSHVSKDEVLRGVTGMGPQRNTGPSDAAEITKTFKGLDLDLSLDEKYYLSADPERERALMMNFGGKGTKDAKVVSETVKRYASKVKYWEGRNEPNFGSSGQSYALNELKPFYETVKAVDPSLKVMGPGTVSISKPMLAWIEQFLKAGGGKYLDAFSFHAYNNINGDLWLARSSLDSLNELLRKYGLEKMEKWQTEQGYFAAIYGVYQPRHQGRWTMLQMMVFEQYQIPKEHNHLWYDKSHGFWAVPAWWENEDCGPNPAVPLMRVWSEELFGKRYEKAFDFGSPGNQLYIGSLFSGKAGSVAAFMSGGDTEGTIDLNVKGAKSVRTVSAFGVEGSLPVVNGRAKLKVPELPVYVELEPGQSCEVVPTDWGPNLAREGSVQLSTLPDVKPDWSNGTDNDIHKLVNGRLETLYWEFKPEFCPWQVNNRAFPLPIEISFAQPQQVGRVVIFASVPWQWQGSLLDYELQYANKAGKWITLTHVQEPSKTFGVVSPVTRTSVDSYYSERCIFENSFAPVTASKLRVVINDCTCGGCPNKMALDAGGQGYQQHVTLREIEVYGK